MAPLPAGPSAHERVAQQLDARGLRCPIPVLRAKRALETISPGQCLRVLATDPDAVRDLRRFCDLKGHILRRHWFEAEVYHFILERGPEASHAG